MKSAYRYFNECVQLSRKQGFGRIEVANFSMLGDTRLYLLQLQESVDDSAERYATALETYTNAEPLPWTDFVIAKGRAMAKFGRGERDDASLEELQHLLDEAESVGFKSASPALEGVIGTAHGH